MTQTQRPTRRVRGSVAVFTYQTHQERCLALADAHGYSSDCPPGHTIGAVFSVDGSQLLALGLRIPSASEAGVCHTATYTAAGEATTCDCPAGGYGRPCWHQGVMIRGGRYVARRAALGWPED